MYSIEHAKILEQGDWENIQKLEQRIAALEENVNNLVTWAMSIDSRNTNNAEDSNIVDVSSDENIVE